MVLLGVVAKTAWRGIRCSSVSILKSSACKFSVVTLCKCICLETLIFLHNLKNRKHVISHAFHLACCFALLKSKTVTIVFSGISISYLINNSSNLIGIDTAFTELTRDNRLFCTREEKKKRKECLYCRHTEF